MSKGQLGFNGKKAADDSTPLVTAVRGPQSKCKHVRVNGALKAEGNAFEIVVYHLNVCGAGVV